MDKETILSYINETYSYLKEGKLIKAYETFMFLRTSIRGDVEKKIKITETTDKLEERE